jgi:outer membrane protein TolC
MRSTRAYRLPPHGGRHLASSTARRAAAACARAMLVSSLVVVAAPARAEPAEAPLPADPALGRLIAESLSARPEVAKSEAMVEVEKERVPQAGAMPDPMLQVGIQNDGFTSIEIGRMGTSYVSFMASQTFPWPGKLRLQGDVAKLGVTRAEHDVARARLSTEAEVRRDYLDLVLVRDRLALLVDLEAIWRRSAGVARLLYETGSSTQSDVLRADVELRRIAQRRFALQAEERTRVQNLNRLRNHPLDEPIATATHIRDLPPPSTFEGRFSAERALAKSPELASVRLDVARAGKSVELAQKTYYPDLTVGTGIMVRGAIPPMWVVTVGGPVPVFAASKQSRAVAENRARAGAARSDVATLEQVVRLRSAERHAAFSALLQTIDVYDKGLLVQSQATAESTLTGYRVGKLTFASVLEANAGFVADQDGYLESVAAAYRILISEAEDSLAPAAIPGASVAAAGGMPGAGATSMGATAGTASAGGISSAGAGEPPPAGGSSAGM